MPEPALPWPGSARDELVAASASGDSGGGGGRFLRLRPRPIPHPGIDQGQQRRAACAGSGAPLVGARPVLCRLRAAHRAVVPRYRGADAAGRCPVRPGRRHRAGVVRLERRRRRGDADQPVHAAWLDPAPFREADHRDQQGAGARRQPLPRLVAADSLDSFRAVEPRAWADAGRLLDLLVDDAAGHAAGACDLRECRPATGQDRLAVRHSFPGHDWHAGSAGGIPAGGHAAADFLQGAAGLPRLGQAQALRAQPGGDRWWHRGPGDGAYRRLVESAGQSGRAWPPGWHDDA